ncbi:putative Phosphoribosylamine--glycine ligase [Xenorhabdus bovienii str. kraussei Quebec]|uniref:Putative Phosphoribosylamine--glycine ligase n=1 Tax=Xenorhabdus bovienii str. kraussei Quebec TaxID=1398203 RepID=A0A077PIA3_XENBV|nr:hypothetical protein [Xenorhabdus bovienii]CDH20377.1 putative Phosphoribosylamine--glycine ligase [Xenorhabdus bovienii str. kraussei Quebec]
MNVVIYGVGDARDYSTFLRLRNDAISYRAKVYLFLSNRSNYWLMNEENVHYCPKVEIALKLSIEKEIKVVLILNPQMLISGAIDIFSSYGYLVFGPSATEAKLEGSKEFGKKIMKETKIPTPHSVSFNCPQMALNFLTENWSSETKFVIKSDKMLDDANVRSQVPDNLNDARACVSKLSEYLYENCIDSSILIEEHCSGAEFSIHVVLNHNSYVILPPTRDYKRRYSGGIGPNTHGMAAISFSRRDLKLLDEINNSIIRPTFNYLVKNKYSYPGILYFGVMITSSGPKLIEYNVRPGNPEWISLLNIIESNLYTLICDAANNQQLSICILENTVSLSVFLTTDDYPHPENYLLIPDSLRTRVNSPKNIQVLSENLSLNDKNQLIGKDRVFNISTISDDYISAMQSITDFIESLALNNLSFRSDAGKEFTKGYLDNFMAVK